jgi:leucyl-tRNA synthetase
MYTLFATSPDRELDWQDEGVEGIQRFLDRAHRFIARHGQPDPVDRKTDEVDYAAFEKYNLSPSARALQRKLHQTIKRVSDDFAGRWHFNTSVSAIMELLNDANRRMLGSEDTVNPNTGEHVKGDKISPGLLATVQRSLVLLLAPFAPYIAHELWEMLGEKSSLLKAPWPKYDPALAKEEELEIPVQINGKLRGKIVVPADASEDMVIEHALAEEKVKAAVAGKQIVKKIYVPGKLLNLVIK